MGVVSHGIDLVEVARFDRVLREHGTRFVERCFTDREQAYADTGRRLRTQRYAVRFAAKEAVLKALGTGWRSGITWRDIEVVPEPSGAPRLHLTGRSAELAADLGISRWHVSLSHTESNAVASVIGLSAPW